MRRSFVLMSLMVLLPAAALAQGVDIRLTNRPQSRAIIPMPFGSRANPDATSALWLNPAAVGVDGSSGAMLLWPNDENGFESGLGGLGINLGGAGFGWERVETPSGTAHRYTLASSTQLGAGVHVGAAYHWSSGLDRQNAWDFGVLVRPTTWLSLGMQATDLGGAVIDGVQYDPTYHYALALRPLGPRLTLSLDGTLDEQVSRSGDPAVMADWEVLPGILLRGGYGTESETVFAGLSLRFGGSEVGGLLGQRSAATSGMAKTGGASWVRFSNHRAVSVFDPILPKRVVQIRLSGGLVETPSRFGFFRNQRSLVGLLGRIEELRNDPSVSTLLLDVDGFRAGRGDLEELHEALLSLREAGVSVAVYAHNYGMGTMYLASAADRVYLYPAGLVAIPGFYLKNFYGRDLLDKLNLQPEFYTVGEYKSAAEPLMNREMSDEAREQLLEIASTWRDSWVETVAAGRSVPIETASAWIDSALMSGDEALEAGVVDALVYVNEIKEQIKKDFALSSPIFLPERLYTMSPMAYRDWEDMTSPQIAIVFAEGTIELGESHQSPFSDDRTIGGETLARAIRDARENRRVAAIVLRVDSPGGLALASDVITYEVQRTVDRSVEGVRHIPVIVSMSDIAASGGYHISALADKIVATRSTLTGSIGVVFGRLNVSTMLDSIGVHLDGVTLGQNAGLSGLEPWNKAQERLIRKEMDKVYDDFLTVVSQGRHLSKQEVDEIGRGRVWSGEEAIKLGLVDQQGGLLDALQLAEREAGLEGDVGVVYYPRASAFQFRARAGVLAAEKLPEPIKTIARLHKRSKLLEGRVMMLSPLDHEDTIQP